MIAAIYAHKPTDQAGVRIFLYLEDRERTIDSPTEKLLLNVAAFADELERERARQRVYGSSGRRGLARSAPAPSARIAPACGAGAVRIPCPIAACSVISP
jgi:hypothetical protein